MWCFRNLSLLLIAGVLLMKNLDENQVAESSDRSGTSASTSVASPLATNSTNRTNTMRGGNGNSRFSTRGRMKSQSRLSINVCTSKICGLVYFVETIAGRPHMTDKLREWYFAQKGGDATLDKEICDKYSKFLNGVGNKYDAPDSTGRQMTLSQRIACITIDCQTLDELLGKLKPILTADDLAVVADAYKHFEPTYETLIWKPRYERLMQQLEDFQEGLKRVQLLARLEQVRKFMRSKWPDSTPFDTIIIPVPDEPRSSHADSVGKTQIVELTAEDTFADKSDVLFHELCHSLWDKANQKKIQKDFEKFDGAVAFRELNEALATALGQGWFRHVTYPNEPPRPVWYRREITENYGRGLYPLVDEYLRDGRYFDVAFAKKATQIFAQKCSQVLTEVCNTYAVLIKSEHALDYQKLQDAMFAAMPDVRSIAWEDLANANFSKKVKSRFAKARQIVLLSPEAIDTLTAHGLTERQVLLLKQRATDCICVTVNDSDIIFCIGNDVETQTELFLKLLRGNYPSSSQ
jgi:hypothetical protein